MTTDGFIAGTVLKFINCVKERKKIRDGRSVKKRNDFMTETFEKFIEKHCEMVRQVGIDNKYILVKELGEWAWAEFAEVYPKSHGKEVEEWWFAQGQMYTFEEIATACLGKEEVDKRMKGVG